jgi:hypothetical protein
MTCQPPAHLLHLFPFAHTHHSATRHPLPPLTTPLPPATGEVTAASCLDRLAKDGDCVLVDIRTGKEKESSGVPDVPSGGSNKVIEVEYAFTEDKKLRGQLKDVGAIEATVRGRGAAAAVVQCRMM